MFGGILELVLEAADLFDPVHSLSNGLLTLTFLYVALEDGAMGHQKWVFWEKHHFVKTPVSFCKEINFQSIYKISNFKQD